MRFRNFGGISKYGLEPQFFPGVAELQKYGPAEAQESAATSINVQIKQQIRQLINQILQRNPDSAGEAQNVYNDLLEVDSWVRSSNSMFKEAPMVPPHRKAHELVATILTQTPEPAPPPPPPKKEIPKEETEDEAGGGGSSAQPAPAPASDILGPLKERLAQLQAIVAQRKTLQSKYKEQLAKEAKYTRDTQQNRPKGSGYVTESEQAMGAQTGYGEFSLPNSKLLLAGSTLVLVWYLLKCK